MHEGGIHAVVPAAGRGHRFGGDVPKQYRQLPSGITVIEASIRAVLSDARVDRVMVALAPGDPHWAGLEIATDPRVLTCEGGAERAMSVLSALEALLRKLEPDAPIAAQLRDTVRARERQRRRSRSSVPQGRSWRSSSWGLVLCMGAGWFQHHDATPVRFSRSWLAHERFVGLVR
jgi:hypothetical protein